MLEHLKTAVLIKILAIYVSDELAFMGFYCCLKMLLEKKKKKKELSDTSQPGFALRFCSYYIWKMSSISVYYSFHKPAPFNEAAN